MRVVSRFLYGLHKQTFPRTITVQSFLGSSPIVKSDLPKSPTFSASKLKFSEIEQTQLGFLNPFKSNLALKLRASREGVGLIQETKESAPTPITKANDGSNSFAELKNRFLSFKKHKYLENLECYQQLAQAQAPKFLVISCADSRVCPSYILGFQPGEAFVVRNVANLVPAFENGPCETNAALEFSVNALEVENILVTGHSCCGGIRALMSMEDEEKSSSFIKNWVVVGNPARSSTKAISSNLSFDQQCRHCEKESINNSLLNLLTYPWVKERVAKGLLSLHGGYYNFVDCTYEKWTLDYQRSSRKQETGGFAIKNREFWS
uniref:beta carbonic anhydrase 5, chloroplastic isoform X1 n=1 Tax=Erigeron canadensis TaxID=72917 RepID=UPI001CB9554F|nr:beta carbonic anhydrase 5, chloroplastic isoform X1 [Erigeron canadensis]